MTTYNNGMGGVDVSNQMTDHYAAELRTVKWWKKVVFHLIDWTVTNSYICYKLNPNIQEKLKTHPFLVQLVERLIDGYQEPRKKVCMPSIGCPEVRKVERHFIQVIPEKKRKKCAVCAQDRNKGLKGTHITTWCPDCGVGLCKGECFKTYHE